MLQIKIAHENIELTEAIKSYVEEKIGSVSEYMDNLQIADVMVGKATNHHNKGEVYHCRVNLTYPGGMFRAEENSEDLYKSIDLCKDILKLEITKFKEKHSNR